MAKKKKDRKEIKLYMAKAICDYYKTGTVKKITIPQVRAILKRDFKKDVGDTLLREMWKDVFNEYINFSVHLKAPRNRDLERLFEKRFRSKGLEKAIIVDLYPNDTTLESLGQNAAEFFEKNVRNGDTVVLSCGTTINEMISKIDENKKYEDLKIISSIVLCVDSFQRLSPSILIHNFTSRFPGAKGFAYHIPEEVRKCVQKTNSVANLLDKAIFKKALEADYFFLGIGALSKNTSDEFTAGFNSLVKQLNLYDELYEEECCGEISYWPLLKKPYGGSYWYKDRFDYYTKNYNGELNYREKSFFDYVFTVNFSEIINMKKQKMIKGKVVAVAGGRRKEIPIHTCLKIDNFIDTLITDANTAMNILKLK